MLRYLACIYSLDVASSLRFEALSLPDVSVSDLARSIDDASANAQHSSILASPHFGRTAQPPRTYPASSCGSQEIQTMHRSNPNSVSTSHAEAWESHDLEHGKLRPRPMSRLASYLSAHRSPDKAEPGSFDWSGIGAKDEDYAPKPDMMSNAILQHVLINPTMDLPARYNSFLLHVLEDYRRLTLENQEQSLRLQVEINSHWEDSEQFRRTLELFNRERNSLTKLPIRSGLNSEEEALEGRVSNSSASAENHPIPHLGGIYQHGELNRPTCDALLRYPGQSPRRHTSPSRSMTITSRILSVADGDQEILLPVSSNTLRSMHPANVVERSSDVASKSPSDLPNTSLPPPQMTLVSRLAQRYAERLGCQPSELINEMVDTCSSTLLQTESDLMLRTVPSLHSPANSEAWHHRPAVHEMGRADTPPVNALRRETLGDRAAQRSFSFYPGDDAKAPSLSDANRGIEDLQLSQSKIPLYDHNSSRQRQPARTPSTGPGSAASADIASNRAFNASATEDAPRSRAHRENSARSVTTAIKDSSYRNSPGSKESSPRVEQAGARRSLDHSEQRSFAVAAARAAGFRDISDRKTG